MGKTNIQKQKSGIMLHYFVVLALTVFGIILTKSESLTWPIIGISLSSVIAIWTYLKVYANKGLWKQAHTRKNLLSGLQQQQVDLAVSKAYQIFTMIILGTAIAAILIFRSRIAVGPIEVVFFLYFAHILPASILGWHGQDFTQND